MLIQVIYSPCWDNEETKEKITLVLRKVVNTHSDNPFVLEIEKGNHSDLQKLTKAEIEAVIVETPKKQIGARLCPAS